MSSCSLEVFGVHWVPSSWPDLGAATVWITDDMTPCGPTLTQPLILKAYTVLLLYLTTAVWWWSLMLLPVLMFYLLFGSVWVNYILHWVKLSLVVLGPVLAVLGYMSDWLSFFSLKIKFRVSVLVFYRCISDPWRSLLCLLHHHQVPWVMEPCLNLSPPFIDLCAQFYNQRSIIHTHSVSWG